MQLGIVWKEVARLLDIPSILALESTCKALRNLFADYYESKTEIRQEFRSRRDVILSNLLCRCLVCRKPTRLTLSLIPIYLCSGSCQAKLEPCFRTIYDREARSAYFLDLSDLQGLPCYRTWLPVTYLLMDVEAVALSKWGSWKAIEELRAMDHHMIARLGGKRINPGTVKRHSELLIALESLDLVLDYNCKWTGHLAEYLAGRSTLGDAVAWVVQQKQDKALRKKRCREVEVRLLDVPAPLHASHYLAYISGKSNDLEAVVQSAVQKTSQLDREWKITRTLLDRGVDHESINNLHALQIARDYVLQRGRPLEFDHLIQLMYQRTCYGKIQVDCKQTD